MTITNRTVAALLVVVGVVLGVVAPYVFGAQLVAQGGVAPQILLGDKGSVLLYYPSQKQIFVYAGLNGPCALRATLPDTPGGDVVALTGCR